MYLNIISVNLLNILIVNFHLIKFKIIKPILKRKYILLFVNRFFKTDYNRMTIKLTIIMNLTKSDIKIYLKILLSLKFYKRSGCLIYY